MAEHAHVPKFGNWEGDDNVSYTQFFESERKVRTGGKLINPSDSPKVIAAVSASPLRNASYPEILKSKHKQHTSRGDGDLHRLADSPAHHDAVVWKPSTDASHQRHEEWVTSQDHRRTNKMSGGNEHSMGRFLLHPHYQVKSASKDGVSSPSWERKDSAEAGHGFAPSPSTPGRSKLTTIGRGDPPADKGSTVPKFGDWDESDPSSADGYTRIFNKVKEEKQVGAAKTPIIKTDPVYDGGHQQDFGNSDSSTCSCFGWCRKKK